MRRPAALLLVVLVGIVGSGSAEAAETRYVVFDARLKVIAVPESISAGDTVVVRVDPRFSKADPTALHGVILDSGGVRKLHFANDAAIAAINAGGAPSTCTFESGNTPRGFDGDWALHSCVLNAAQTRAVLMGPAVAAVAGAAAGPVSLTPAGGAVAAPTNFAQLLELKTGKTNPATVTVTKDATANVIKITLLPVEGGAFEGEFRASAGPVRIRVKYDPGALVAPPPPLPTETADITLKVRSQDEHFNVRVHPTLMTANRLREVSLAIAVAPVRDKFFETGPWTCSGYAAAPSGIGEAIAYPVVALGRAVRDGFQCGYSPIGIVRIRGENVTTVEFGFGLAFFLNRFVQLNGGLLFGTTDNESGWRPDRRWFIGLGLDPFLMAEVLSQGKEK